MNEQDGKGVVRHHALVCDSKSQWRQTYISNDESGQMVALEFHCPVHKTSAWLTLPPAPMTQEHEAGERPMRQQGEWSGWPVNSTDAVSATPATEVGGQCVCGHDSHQHEVVETLDPPGRAVNVCHGTDNHEVSGDYAWPGVVSVWSGPCTCSNYDPAPIQPTSATRIAGGGHAEEHQPTSVEECASKSHSWELWTYDPVRWPAYCELGCTVCGSRQWFIKAITAPEGYQP